MVPDTSRPISNRITRADIAFHRVFNRLMMHFSSATTPMPLEAETQSLFLDIFTLPFEIRELIWECVFRGPTGFQLLLLSKEIRRDAIAVYYRTTTFRIYTPAAFREIMSNSTRDHIKQIRFLELAVECLYLTDHAEPGHLEHSSLKFQEGKELEVNEGLRAWGSVFHD
jgi:hypothetical protein